MAQRVAKRLAKAEWVNDELCLYRRPNAFMYGGIEPNGVIFSAFRKVYGKRFIHGAYLHASKIRLKK